MSATEESAHVIVVGGGPIGLTVALELAYRGVPSGGSAGSSLVWDYAGELSSSGHPIT